MSVQKLIAEAEKLLDKKKPAEAIERLKSVLGLEPLNQLAVTRLANIYLDQNDRPNAARVYAELASRLTEAGKSAIAIAIYKQAIEIAPDNMELRLAYAKECEEMGKVGDAQVQAQAALQHYLRRKKYLDAAGVMPVLVRLGNRDDLKAAWIEVIQNSLGEQKLPHLLVALSGPPGLVSTEFNVGGDAALLSEGLYDGLKNLVKFFPRDPRLPYAVAWAAHRRDRKADFYEFLRESIRREPDFCLSYLLFARALAEANSQPEAAFVYKIIRERLPADRSVDMLTLNRLVEAFAQKFPWVGNGDGSLPELEPAGFLASLLGDAKPAASPPAPAEAAPAPELTAAATPLSAPAPVIQPVDGDPEISFAIEPATATQAAEAPPVAPGFVPPPPEEPRVLFAQEPPAPVAIVVPVESAVAMPPPIQSPIPAPVAAPTPIAPAAATTPAAASNDDSVEFTGIIKVSPEFSAGGEGTGFTEVAPAPAAGEIDPSSLLLAAEMAAPSEDTEAAPVTFAAGPATTLSSGFNPLEALDLDALTREIQTAADRTQIFTPMDVLAAKESARERFDVKTRLVEAPDLGSTVATSGAAGPSSVSISYHDLRVDGAATQIYSPIDAISAASDSRRPAEASSAPASAAPTLAASVQDLSQSGEATMVLSPGAAPADGATQVMSAQDLLPADLLAGLGTEPPAGHAALDFLATAGEATAVMTTEGPVLAPAPVISFQPIPTLTSAPKPAAVTEQAAPASVAAEVAALAGAEIAEGAEEKVDLGDDLLAEPTRILTVPPKLIEPAPEATRHLLEEVRKEVRENKAERPDADAMLRRAERYIVKQNYYLARKALRLALDLGADGDRVKNRLRDIRKIEMPTSLYGSTSVDDTRESASDILARLEADFGLDEPAREEETSPLHDSISEQLERIFRENDPRSILDFGVGLHEMGLFRSAEEVFTRISAQFPDLAFDAYYLAAVTKFSRRDYAGAASILKHLSAEVGRSEEEKIQIYYTLGELFARMRRPERSREFFKKVADLDSNYRNVRHKLES